MLGLLALFALSAPMLFVGLGTRDVGRAMENISLLSSQETFLRQHGADGFPKVDHAWLLPYASGQPRVQKPPMLVWANLLAWSDLTPQTSTPQQLAHRARVLAAGMTLLAALGTFWIGATLRDGRLGLLAAGVLLTMHLLERQARTATYDIHLTAWVTLAAGAGLWALAPTRPSVTWRRAAAGALACGVFTAMGWLTKGPLACVLVAVPVVAAATLSAWSRRRWRRSLVVLVGGGAVATALALPWYVYAAHQVEGLGGALVTEFAAQRAERQTTFYYLMMPMLVVPWTFWLVGGLLLPWFSGARRARRGTWLAWIWFVVLLVLFSVPGAKQQRYILPLLPAAALLCALVWRDYDDAAARGRPKGDTDRLLIPHWAALAAGSLGLGAWMALRPTLAGWGWADRVHAGATAWPWWLAAALSLGLLMIAWCGWRGSGSAVPSRGAWATVAWALLAGAVWWPQYDGVVREDRPWRIAAEELSPWIAGRPWAFVSSSPDEQRALMDHEELLYYLRRIPEQVTPEALTAQDASAEHGMGTLVIAQQGKPAEQRLREHGYHVVTGFRHWPLTPYRLWTREPDHSVGSISSAKR